MTKGKDSAEVVKFLNLLARVKDCWDNNPACLSEVAKKDEGVKEICDKLYLAAALLVMNERRHRQLFAAPVDPNFLTAWRDFEDRFMTPVAAIYADILAGASATEPG